jgi:hypothetical protein
MFSRRTFSLLLLLFSAEKVAAQQSERITLRQVLRVERELEDLELDRIVEGMFTPDNHLVFVNARAGRLERLSSSGRLESAIGRVGSGPGEFRSPSRIGWKRDTLWVYDGTLRRVTFFLGEKVVRTMQYTSPLLEPFSVLEPLSFHGSETDIGVAAFSRGLRDPAALDRGFPVLRRRSNKGRIDTLSWLTRRNWSFTLQFVRGGVLTQRQAVQPLSDAPLYIGRRTGGIVLVDRFVGPDSRFVVSTYDGDGALVGRQSLPYRPVLIDDRLRDSVIARVTTGVPSGSLERNSLQQMFVPRHLPTVTAITAATDGYVWVRREEAILLPKQRFTLIDRRGGVVGEVMLERDAQVLDSNNGRVAVVTRNTDDLPVITVFAFRPLQAKN